MKSKINEAGRMSTDRRNEGQLVCDVLGLESLVDEITYKLASDAKEKTHRHAKWARRLCLALRTVTELTCMGGSWITEQGSLLRARSSMSGIQHPMDYTSSRIQTSPI